MAFPSRTLASIKTFARLPFFVINDPSDTNPVFFVNDASQPPQAVGLNIAAFLTSAGLLNAANSLAANSIAGVKLASGTLRVTVADGVDEAAADITVTGMVATDEIVAVVVYTTKASIASQVLRPAGDFVPGAGKAVSTANKVDSTGNQYMIIWNKLT